jgi:hypothetical protein
MRTHKLGPYGRKSADIMLAYIRGELSNSHFRAALRELDAQNPYEVIEETWRQHDGSRVKRTKILARGSCRIIGQKTERITPDFKVVKHTARLSNGATLTTYTIVNVDTGKPVGMSCQLQPNQKLVTKRWG